MIKKFLVVVVAVLVIATFGAHKGVALAVGQPESAIPTTGDSCGGTGGAGQSNHNGTFSADTVVPCNGASTSDSVVMKNDALYKNAKRNIDFATILLVSLIWLGAVIFLYSRKNKRFVYLLMFTIFYIYLCMVMDYTLVQYQSLLVLKHFVPDVMLKGIQEDKSLNLIPLVTLAAKDVKTSLLNILLFTPFGFGLPFITSFRIKKVVIFGTYLASA